MARKMKKLEVVQGHLTKEQQAVRADAERDMFDLPAVSGNAPDWLDDLARAEWQRLLPLITGRVPVSELDLPLFASYCQAYSDVQRAQADIAENGQTFTADNGMVRMNPSVKLKLDATNQMMRLAGELGLSVYSRVRMQIKSDGSGQEDPFLKLVKQS